MNNLYAALKKLFKAVAPDRCEICGSVIELEQQYCDQCKTLKHIGLPRCEFCGCESDDCACSKRKNEYKQIVAPYYYSGTVVDGIHNFKECNMPFLANSFSKHMIKAINECCSDIVFDYVTFVPMRRFKKFARGFNQSELLARKISAAMHVSCCDMLDKVRYTGVQHKKSAKERRLSAFGAYDIKPSYRNKLNGSVVLLIDDVKTTGSTLNECAKMLKIYGASEVYAAVFAVSKINDYSRK